MKPSGTIRSTVRLPNYIPLPIFNLMSTMVFIAAVVVVSADFVVGDDCVGSISEVEYRALEALFNSTDGENWRWLPDAGSGPASHWHFPATLTEPCGSVTWEGLHCNATNGDATVSTVECYISDILLAQHNLAGTFPAALGTLTELEKLDLSHNFLAASVPEEVGGMASLMMLNLENNYLSQQIPSEIAMLTSLEILYLSSNLIHGTIPTEIGLLSQLFGLYLSTNLLVSTTPTELGMVSALVELEINSNYITGSIPSEICDMLLLSRFDGYNNALSGTVPACFGRMSKMHQLAIIGNALSGTIPSLFGDMVDIMNIGCSSNFFTGRIPTEIYGLQHLEQLLLTENFLSGTLSPTVSSLVSVYQLEAGINLLSGPVPSGLFIIPGLASLLLDYNRLSSTIPDTLYSSTSLKYLYFDYNSLVGTVSDSFSNMTALLYLSVAANFLTGVVPSSLYGLHRLKEVSLHDNMFTGTISASIGNWSDLGFLDYGNCLFTGPFPGRFSELYRLKSFTTEANYLTGSLILPLSSTTDMILQDLEIGSNFLSGQLPAGFSNFRHLEEFTAPRNLFTGKIDYLFNKTGDASLGKLIYIDLAENALTGTIPEALFIGTRHTPLTAVVLYQNCFTGSLPSSICQAGNLSTLILDSVSSAPACDVRFTGLWKDLFKVIIGKRALHGTIPECIWSMRSLQTVHLAGNGLGGTLTKAQLTPVISISMPTVDDDYYVADDLNIDDFVAVNRTVYMLNDVNLASNALTGTLPLSWQQWPWKSLDLSGNKLTGILSEGFAVNNTCSSVEMSVETAADDYTYSDDDTGHTLSPYSPASNSSQICGVIDLTVNRLSGRIPGAFRYAQGVNILDGNLFDCEPGSLPEYDPAAMEYVCGSSDFNDSLILWASLCLLSVVVLFILCGTKLVSEPKWLPTELLGDSYVQICLDRLKPLDRAESGRSIHRYISFLQRIAALSIILGSFYLCICMLVYAGMKASQHQHGQPAKFSTHTYQYAWLSTAAYLHGPAPVAVIMLFLFLSLIIIANFFLFDRRLSSGKTDTELPLSQSYRVSSTSTNLPQNQPVDVGKRLFTSEGISSATVRLPASVSNKFVWLPAVRIFVLVVIHAVVMICINILYIYILLTGLSSNFLLFLVQFTLSVFKLFWNRHYVSFVVSVPVESGTAQSISTSAAVKCSSFMVLFTFIISPVLATFFSDDTCFRYFITGQSAVDSSFQTYVYSCFLYCSVECTAVCGFTRASKVTIFTSVVPSWQYSYQCSSSLLVNYTPVLLYSFAITGVLMPLLRYIYCQLSAGTIERYIPRKLITRFLTGTIYDYKKPDACVNEGADEPSEMDRSRMSAGVSVISRAYMDIGVLLTFGMASPLLAIAICMDCVNLYFGWKALILRWLSIFVYAEPTEPSADVPNSFKCSNDANKYLEILGRLTNVVTAEASDESVTPAGAKNGTHAAAMGDSSVLWMVVWIAGLFWGLFAFDMYGDIYGAVDGLCMILVPTAGGAIVFYLESQYRWFGGCWRTISGFCSYVQIAARDRKSSIPATEKGNDTFTLSVRSPIIDPQNNSSVFDDGTL
jgi:Leucine-rich repeat (LRR) protein